MKKYFYEIVILALVIFIFVTNYKPGTYLIGWDNYQTDLAPWLGVKRALFSVWQEGQSFGLVTGMGHAADLVRAFAVFLLSLFLPQSLLRYALHFLILLAGGLGMFRMLRSVGFDKEKKLFAFLGALFYLFNFATVQILFIPFESFSVMYGLLPWAVWIFLHVISQKKITKKDWLVFTLINILITPQALSQQLFVVYLLVLCAMTLGFFIQERSLFILRKAFIAVFFIVVINSFWLLPQMYFLKTSRSVAKEAKANQLHTGNIFNQNLSKGNIKDFLLLRGFHYDLLDTGRGDGLFQEWKNHFNKPLVSVAIYIFALLPLVGLLSRRKFHLAFVAAHLLIASVLLLDTFPFSLINQLLHRADFLNQVFRSPFTKFIVPYSLVVSYLVVVGLDRLYKTVLNNRIGLYLVSIFTIGGIFIYAFPSFYGYYFSPRMRATIPKDYFEIMDYFKHEDKNKRIAMLPEYTFWGWLPYKWGYLGSGFLWYGIEQPIVSRTFDVWSLESESFFWQLKAALEKEDLKRLEQVLDKYNITYLLFDDSLLPYGNSPRSLQFDRTRELLEKSNKIELIKKTPVLTLYEYLPTQKVSDNFISVSSNLPKIGPSVKITNDDTAYFNFGPYQTDKQSSYQRYYPFLGMTSETKTRRPLWNIKEDEKSFTVEMEVEPGVEIRNYIVPEGEKFYALDRNWEVNEFDLPITVGLTNKSLAVSFDKKIIDSADVTNTTVDNWNERGEVKLEKKGNSILVSGSDFAQPNVSYFFPSLSQRYGYIVKVQTAKIRSERPYININDLTKQQRVIEDTLENDTEYYVLSPHFQFGQGYFLTLYNYSYPGVPMENEIKSVTVYAFPYEQVKNLVSTDGKEIQTAVLTPVKGAVRKNYYLYTIADFKSSDNNDSTLILYQSFNAGWRAYKTEGRNFTNTHFPFLFGKEIKNHVLINNWANGWRLPPGDSGSEAPGGNIVIIFWPQYLEFIGFGLLVVGLLYIIVLYGRTLPSSNPKSQG